METKSEKGELVADAVSVQRGDQGILFDVDLSVAPGEVLGLLGPNGAGKSTLLKLLSGEEAPTAGAVRLNGRNIGEWSPGDLARRRAVLPQESPLAFPFRVRDVVMLGRMPFLKGAESGIDFERGQLALERAGVAHLSERIYTRLSGGERQRVHLARVLAQLDEPERSHAPGETSDQNEISARFLLLDEPTASLDLLHQHDVLRSVRELASEGVGVLVVLHDLNLAARYADRIALLKAGRVARIGSPAETITSECIQEVFGIAGRVEQLEPERMLYFVATP